MHGVGLTVAAAALLADLGLVQARPQAPAIRLPCYSYDEIARQLRFTYREAPVSLGLQADGNLLQVFSSPATGSWTIVSTSPAGLACVLAAGQNWETVTPAKLDPAA